MDFECNVDMWERFFRATINNVEKLRIHRMLLLSSSVFVGVAIYVDGREYFVMSFVAFIFMVLISFLLLARHEWSPATTKGSKGAVILILMIVLLLLLWDGISGWLLWKIFVPSIWNSAVPMPEHLPRSIVSISPEAWIALFSFIVALAALWTTSLSPAKISANIGNAAAFYFAGLTKDERKRDLFSICLPLLFFNRGARTGIIENLALRVRFGDEEQSHIYKISRELREIRIFTKENGQIDAEQMSGNTKDLFASITLSGKSPLRMNFLFWPASEEEIKVTTLHPSRIHIELLLQVHGKWMEQGETSFINNSVNINGKFGWTMVESDESIASVLALSNSRP